jgi:ferredoxin
MKEGPGNILSSGAGYAMALNVFSPPVASEALRDQLETISQRCIECGLCVEECHFLKRHGAPKAH